MKGEKRIYPIKKYDERQDVLHVYLNKRCNEYYASAIEEEPEVYILRDDDTNEIVGLKILDYTKNAHKVRKKYPQYNLSKN